MTRYPEIRTCERSEPLPRQRASVDLYVFGRDAPPVVREVKALASGEGFATLVVCNGKHGTTRARVHGVVEGRRDRPSTRPAERW
jgi:hypothetical protein